MRKGTSRHAPAGDNTRWYDIERAFRIIDEHPNIFEVMTANQVNYIRDLYKRGASYHLSEKQHQYLNACLRKVPYE